MGQADGVGGQLPPESKYSWQLSFPLELIDSDPLETSLPVTWPRCQNKTQSSQSLARDAAMAVLRTVLSAEQYGATLEQLVTRSLTPEAFVAQAVTDAVMRTGPDAARPSGPPERSGRPSAFLVRPAYRDLIRPVLSALYVMAADRPDDVDRRNGVSAVVLQHPGLKLSQVVAGTVRGVDDDAERALRDTSKRNGGTYLNQLIAIAVSAAKGQTTRNAETAQSSIPFVLKTTTGKYPSRAIGLVNGFDDPAKPFIANTADGHQFWEELVKSRHAARTTEQAVECLRRALAAIS